MEKSSDKVSFTRAELKQIREVIVETQKHREYCIIDGSDADKLRELINHAFLDSFKTDLFDTDD